MHICLHTSIYEYMEKYCLASTTYPLRQAGRHTDRQEEGQIDRTRDRETGWQRKRQTETHTPHTHRRAVSGQILRICPYKYVHIRSPTHYLPHSYRQTPTHPTPTGTPGLGEYSASALHPPAPASFAARTRKR